MVMDAFVGHAAGVPAGAAPLVERRESLVVDRGGRAARGIAGVNAGGRIDG